MAVSFFKSEVIGNKKLNYKFNHLRFKLADIQKDQFSFSAGQFVIVKVTDSLSQSYSVASMPEQLPCWEILVDITPDGPGCRFLKNLKPGDIIETTAPRGVFTLANSAENHILTATGCGFASTWPMAKTLLVKQGRKRVHLFWGLRHERDIVYQNLLDKWQKDYPNFQYELILSHPEGKWAGKVGYTTTHVIELAKKLPANKTNIYLCGNQGLVNDVKEALQKIDFPEERLYFERYY